MALNIALDGARTTGAETQLIDLRDYNLIFADGADDESGYPEDVFRLRREVQSAQGIILGTPEYHGSFSGVLKNALDLMGFDEFEGKIVGLVGVGGGAMGAINALNALQAIGRSMHAWVIPQQASIPEAQRQFESDGTIRDARLRKRLQDVGRQVARFSYLHSSTQLMDFVRLWEEAPANPGGE